MQFADITYRRIPYTPNFEFVFRVLDDDPQPALINPPYMVDFDDNKHIVDRSGYISFNYARTDETENNIPTLTFDEALEIFKTFIHDMYDSEISTLKHKMDFLVYLNSNVDTIESKPELSN